MPPPNAPTFYVDESIFSNALVQSLSSAGVAFATVGRDVPPGAADEVWLEICGRRGWVALTRDQRIRYRTLEKRALKDYHVGAFTFTGGQATAQQTAQRIFVLLPSLLRIATSEPKPFIYTFGLLGPLSRVALK